MRLTIFGLTLSSSWGNGHATLWRGLVRALARQGHRVTFFERDVPYYAAHRDLESLSDAELVLYTDWILVAARARRQLAESDAAMITSYCPDAAAAAQLMFDAPAHLLRERCALALDLGRLQNAGPPAARAARLLARPRRA